MIETGRPNKLTFQLTDASGAYLTGKVVTTQISQDGGAFANATGVVTEIGNGTYLFSGTADDFNCNTYTLRFASAGAKDAFLNGNTDTDYQEDIETLVKAFGVNDNCYYTAYVTTPDNFYVRNATMTLTSDTGLVTVKSTRSKPAIVFHLPIGNYTYQLDCPGFDSQTGNLVIDREKHDVFILQNPQFKYLTNPA